MWLKMVLALLGLGLLAGCKAKYKDISNDPAYGHLVGQRYATLLELNLYGIHGYGNPNNDEIDYYIVINYGFGGHEVLSKEVLENGSQFEILKIRPCTNCLFQKSIKYDISFLPGSTPHNIDKPIHLSDVKNNMVVVGSDGRVELDASIFKEVK